MTYFKKEWSTNNVFYTTELTGFFFQNVFLVESTKFTVECPNFLIFKAYQFFFCSSKAIKFSLEPVYVLAKKVCILELETPQPILP